MSVYANVNAEIILLTEKIENSIETFKVSMECFFSELIERHNCVYDISLDIDGENILKYSSESTQDEVIKLINDKFSYLLNNDKNLLNIVKNLEGKKLNFNVNYNLVNFDFINVLKALYDSYPIFEAEATKTADGKYPSILRFKNGKMYYQSSDNINKFKDGYIEEIALYSTNAMIGFYNSDILKVVESLEKSGEISEGISHEACNLDPLQDKINKSKELLDALDIDDFGYEYNLQSPWEACMDLNSFTLDKHNKKKFISTITEIANMFDIEKGDFYITMHLKGEYENYLESYVIENGQFKIKHLKY